MHFTYKTTGTCAKEIYFEKDADGKVHNVKFTGGCDGNLKAVSKLVEGMNAADISKILKGNKCGRKDTSCADQLATALMKND